MRHNRLFLSLLAALTACPTIAIGGELRSLVRLPPGAYGAQSSGDSSIGAKALSSDGTRIVLTSAADNLAAGGGGSQAYLADRSATSLVMLSRGFDGRRGNASSTAPVLSAGGTSAAWVSSASNLVAGDAPDSSDVFVQRIADGARIRFSPPVEIAAPHTRVARSPRLSADGRRVVFGVASDTGTVYALYAGDTETGAITRLTPALVNDEPEFAIGAFALSGDGTTLVYGFTYPAVGQPPFTQFGAYVQDVTTGARELVTRAPDGTPVNATPSAIDVSQDARYVAFLTANASFVASDANGVADVVVRDRVAGSNRIASFGTNGSQFPAPVNAFALDGSGTIVAFTVGSNRLIMRADATSASVVADPGPATVVSIDDVGGVAFDSQYPGFVAADTNRRRDVFVRAAPGSVWRASHSTTGPWPTVPCCLTSYTASPSGRWVALVGMSLDPALDSRWGVVGRDTGLQSPIVLPTQGNWPMAIEARSIDDEGRKLAYLPGVAPGSIDINPPPPPAPTLPATLLFDRVAGVEVDVALTAGGGYPDGGSSASRVSGDGRFVAFGSIASDLVPGANPLRRVQVYRRDLVTGELRLVSATPAGVGGNDHSFIGTVSRDGRFVTYSSDADDLVAGDSDVGTDVFVWDATTGTTERVSVASDGGEAVNGLPGYIAICDDGSRVAWTDGAFGLVPGGGAFRQAYVRDRVAGTTWRASESGGVAGNADASSARLSGDCTTVAFASAATNLGWSVPPGIAQVWVGNADAGASLELASRDRFDVPGAQSSSLPALNGDGSEVLFLSATGTWTLDGEDTAGLNVFARTRIPGLIFGNGFED